MACEEQSIAYTPFVMKERILITVKTYPTLSLKYAELVCTAGVNERGEWRRIYPIQFRHCLFDNQLQ